MIKKRNSNATVSDWTAVPRDLLLDICKLLLRSECFEDYTAIRGVCTSWRAAAMDSACLNLIKPWPTVPFLILPETCNRRGFYSLTKNKVSMRLPVPDAKGRHCIESRFGWLLTLECRKTAVHVHLLNPFTGARFQLPGFKKHSHSYDTNGSYIIKRSVLSANPSETKSDYVLVVRTAKNLAYWKPGKRDWTVILEERKFVDVNYSDRDQRFYAVESRGNVWAWDPANTEGKLHRVAVPSFHFFYYDLTLYLVESSAGELWLVARQQRNGCGTHRFKVYQIDVINGRVSSDTAKTLNEAIFVGQNAAFSLVPPPNTISSNSIYFTSIAYGMATDMGICSLEDGSIRNFEEFDKRAPETPKDTSYPPLWIAPSSVIFTGR